MDNGTDTDDTDENIFPGCTEVTYYEDADNDGFGNAEVSMDACVQPEGYVTDGTDTDDTNENIFPGCTEVTYYEDADNDGFGNAEVSLAACVQPEGYVTDNTDCDDRDETINPDAEDDPFDGIDSNCDGEVEEVVTIWTGPDMEFSQVREQNWAVEVNQDRLTEKVVFTRQNLGGPIYNFQWWMDNFGRDATKNELNSDFWDNGDLEVETGGTKGVRWAILEENADNYVGTAWDNFELYGTLGDPTNFVSFHNIGSILSELEDDVTPTEVVDDFTILAGGDTQTGTCMPCLEGIKLGVWLVEEDIYLTLTFSHWGIGESESGEFTYTRSTPND